MDLNVMAYPEKFTIAGVEYKGKRNSAEKKVLIPYTEDQILILEMKSLKN